MRLYMSYKHSPLLNSVFSLATLITSKTRYALLDLFLCNPSLESGVRETARALAANLMQTRNELMLLERAGLLKSRRVANSIQFSLDASCPAAGPLKALLDISSNKLPASADTKKSAPADAQKNTEAIDDE